jgi:HNH endonuclease
MSIFDNGVFEPNTGCLLYTLLTNKKGYARAYFKGKYRPITHISYESEYGPIPKGLLVLHKCDTPSCFNPDHLFLGTHKDNVKDCYSKGRAHNQKVTNCTFGHPYAGENLRIYRGHRFCRSCKWYLNRKKKQDGPNIFEARGE